MNILVVHQDFNPTSGGGHTLQAAILRELHHHTSDKFKVITAPQSIINSETAKYILQNFNIDLVWYLYPGKNLFRAPYFSTIWDLSHRAYPVFPEVTHDGWTFDHREEIYRSLLSSLRIFTGTEILKQELCNAYGFEPKRIIVNPFPAPHPLALNKAIDPRFRTLPSSEVRLLIYPAQFWPHKNHATLLKALLVLRERSGKTDRRYTLHFTGSDKGNEPYVRQLAQSLCLSNDVIFHGFVEEDTLFSLYDRAFALIYPSLFGPDNLPPLEAMSRGCPVLTADIEGAREVYSDAAIYFDPLDPLSIAEAAYLLEDDTLRAHLIERGNSVSSERTVTKYVRNVVSEIFSVSNYFPLYKKI